LTLVQLPLAKVTLYQNSKFDICLAKLEPVVEQIWRIPHMLALLTFHLIHFLAQTIFDVNGQINLTFFVLRVLFNVEYDYWQKTLSNFIKII
jgi:hypothetical protein